MNQERERNTQQPLEKKDVERIKKLSTEKIFTIFCICQKKRISKDTDH